MALPVFVSEKLRKVLHPIQIIKPREILVQSRNRVNRAVMYALFARMDDVMS